MKTHDIPDEWIHLAYKFGFFIHRDKEIVMNVIKSALVRFDYVHQHQLERFDKKANARTMRNNCYLPEINLFQRLVYEKSTEREKTDIEVNKGEEELVIRYIKYLTEITFKFNSFRVVNGLCRLLYSYSQEETRVIFETLTQDIDEPKEDDTYRKLKSRLVSLLKERFEKVLPKKTSSSKIVDKIKELVSSESDFILSDNPEIHLPLIKEFLDLVAPWQTNCVLPPDFTVKTLPTNIPQFSIKKNALLNELLEISRMHTIIEPKCFSRLLKGLKDYTKTQLKGLKTNKKQNFYWLDDPDIPKDKKMLSIPKFSLLTNNSNINSNRRNPPSLSQDEIMVLRNEAEADKKRCRNFNFKSISILVDGETRLTLDTAKSSNKIFYIKESEQLIEIYGHTETETLLLDAYLLPYEEMVGGDLFEFSVILANDQRIDFAITIPKNFNDSEKLLKLSTKVLFHSNRKFEEKVSVYNYISEKLSNKGFNYDLSALQPMNLAKALGTVTAITTMFIFVVVVAKNFYGYYAEPIESIVRPIYPLPLSNTSPDISLLYEITSSQESPSKKVTFLIEKPKSKIKYKVNQPIVTSEIEMNQKRVENEIIFNNIRSPQVDNVTPNNNDNSDDFEIARISETSTFEQQYRIENDTKFDNIRNEEPKIVSPNEIKKLDDFEIVRNSEDSGFEKERLELEKQFQKLPARKS